MRKEIILTLRKVLIVLLVLWMIGVFFLSNQNGEDSGAVSHKVALLMSFGNEEKAEIIEPMVRKVAHMTEYGVGAMLFYGILLTYPKVTIKPKIVMTLAFILVYAGLDELHQSFIDARNGSAWDVAIDAFGGAIGTGAMYLMEAMIVIMDNKVKEEVQNASK